MAKIVGYIACSADGYIARKDDSLDWLFKYNGMPLGEFSYTKFIETITTVVMGRGTYDFLAKEEGDWPYPNQRSIIVTSRPIESPKGNLEIWDKSIDALIADLRAQPDGKVWMLGGAQLQTAFMERGALDELEIYIIPEFIGSGIRLFPESTFQASPRLISSQVIEPGCVRVHYSFEK
jgi:dihydrofolate reductase